MLETLAGEIGAITARREKLILVSMAAGVTVERLNVLFGGRLPVIRMMPNLPDDGEPGHDALVCKRCRHGG